MSAEIYREKYAEELARVANARLAWSILISQMTSNELQMLSDHRRELPELDEIKPEELLVVLARKRQEEKESQRDPAICVGLVCYFSGGAAILKKLEQGSAIPLPQGSLSQESVGTMTCAGLCHIAPVARVKGQYYRIESSESLT